MIDLSQLPPPDVLESLEFEALYQGLLDDFRQHMGERWTAQLESDPVIHLLEVAAYQKLLGRARINDAAKASLLSHAAGADLDNRAADYGVQRLRLSEADPDALPPVAAVMESDEDLRYRTRLSLEALSVAGSRGAYEFHARTASAEIADVSVDSPTFRVAPLNDELRACLPAGAMVLECDYAAGLVDPLPGDVSLTLLPRLESTSSGSSLVEAVRSVLSAESVRPLTDRPRIQLGQPSLYRVEASIEVEEGPDPEVVTAAAHAQLRIAVAEARRLQGELPVSAVYAALHVPGVRRVRLRQPAADVVCDQRHYPSCAGIELTQVAP
ncbi:baseplate assembly protein [Pseudomonas soli]|uniref:baseplate assembly protein n=1 Tax=Pseudomonas soli TaxID=1306993 RepID=UPI003829EE41